MLILAVRAQASGGGGTLSPGPKSRCPKNPQPRTALASSRASSWTTNSWAPSHLVALRMLLPRTSSNRVPSSARQRDPPPGP